MTYLGKLLILLGILLVAAGIILLLAPRIPFLGKLPGDIVIKKGSFTLYFPIATSVLLSAVLALMLYLFRSK
ncbi:MAG: DUF2905 domain-containing protein [Elusimicrobiota bacterium]